MRRWIVILLVAGCQTKPTVSLPHEPRVVDVHVHAVSPEVITPLHAIMDEVGIKWALNLSGYWPGTGLLEQQIEAVVKPGIDHQALLKTRERQEDKETVGGSEVE